jgi:tRNA(Ile)-lysidine synthase
VRLGTGVAGLPATLCAEVDLALGARLTSGDAAPLAVAFSGGGDSLALLLAAKAWADRHGRRLHALTVDHRLTPKGADWARWCADRADRLGVAHGALVWEGEKPVAGRSAAARAARHALLADAARAVGAAVILMGHTADDAAEAGLMRAGGSSVPTPRPWAPSPAWPEGRGLFILRPLLGVRRHALRAALSAAGETWIDDPANTDPASARARARLALTDLPPPPAGPLPAASELAGVVEGPAANLTLAVSLLARSADPAGDLSAALLCAAGTVRPPRRASLQRLLDRILAGEAFVATLAGARLEVDGAAARLVRDGVAGGRRPALDMDPPRDRSAVWDGRFVVTARTDGVRVGRLAGRAGRLPASLRRAVQALPPATRPALPVVIHPDGAIDCPTLRPSAAAEILHLAYDRLAAARGAIPDEATLRSMAKPRKPS